MSKKVDVKTAFVNKMMNAYNRPCFVPWSGVKKVGDVLGKGDPRTFYENPKNFTKIKDNSIAQSVSDCTADSLLQSLKFFQQLKEKGDIEIIQPDDKNYKKPNDADALKSGKAIRHSMYKTSDGHWNNEKYEKYRAYSIQKHKIMNKIVKINKFSTATCQRGICQSLIY